MLNVTYTIRARLVVNFKSI